MMNPNERIDVQVYSAPWLITSKQGLELLDLGKESQAALTSMGLKSQSWLVTAQASLSSVSKPLDRPLLTTSSVGPAQALPLWKLLELEPMQGDTTSERPTAIDLAAQSEAILMLPGVSREPARWLARSSRRAVLAVDMKAMDYAGPGGWGRTLVGVDALIITEEAAKMMTARDSMSEAAQTLDNMSRSGLVLVVSDESLCVRARGQEIRLDWISKLEPAQALPRLGAGLAACLIEGKSANETAHALIALAEQAPEATGRQSVTALEAEGQDLVSAASLHKLVQQKQRARNRQLMATAASAALLLVALLSLTWINTLFAGV